MVLMVVLLIHENDIEFDIILYHLGSCIRYSLMFICIIKIIFPTELSNNQYPQDNTDFIHLSLFYTYT